MTDRIPPGSTPTSGRASDPDCSRTEMVDSPAGKCFPSLCVERDLQRPTLPGMVPHIGDEPVWRARCWP